LNSGSYVVVHPGMAGSALNWPIAHYITLIKELSLNTQVVITGTAADEPWLTEIKSTFVGNARVLILQGLLKAPELFTVLKNAKAVVVPSTGVAHMAASLGVPVLGIYSPKRVQHPRRWAARGEKVQIYMPAVADMDQVDPSCMNDIRPEDLLKAIARL
jgi:ADP-heptose:LPS heptosyltransferase